MLHASTKGDVSCYALVSVRFNVLLKFAGTFKMRGFDTLSRCKSQGGGYRVKYGSK